MENAKIDSRIIPLEGCEWLDPQNVKALRVLGIASVQDLVVWGARKIKRSTELDKAVCEKICKKALEVVAKGSQNDSQLPFMTAESLHMQRQSAERISTGCKSLDDLFGGGVEVGAVTELYGEGATGKTQICHALALNVQQAVAKGGLDGYCLYIDSEGTFRPERIVQMAQRKGLDLKQALTRIIAARPYNSAHLELIVEEIGRTIRQVAETGGSIKLIIIDSIIKSFRAEYKGRGELAERQQSICELLYQLQNLAEVHGIAVVITNQIQNSPDAYFGDNIRATGGNIMAHGSTYRIHLKKSGRNRIARMADSPCHAEREVLFTISESGVQDVESRT